MLAAVYNAIIVAKFKYFALFLTQSCTFQKFIEALLDYN